MSNDTIAILAASMSAIWFYSALAGTPFPNSAGLQRRLWRGLMWTLAAAFAILAVYLFAGPATAVFGTVMAAIAWCFAASLASVVAPTWPRAFCIVATGGHALLVLGLIWRAKNGV